MSKKETLKSISVVLWLKLNEKFQIIQTNLKKTFEKLEKLKKKFSEKNI